jgi:RNA polymerase sigma-70 factor (ECF subfamily)
MAEFFDPKSLNNEDSLESLLDEEPDEEFGTPKFQEHFADSLTAAVLKEWSAKDFASIYVRFRPHLERHAKRFLNNSSQVEEVVQDAFLYLMTTLPELDSELGVLRFLKWKTRLLALDVIRANSRVSLAPLDEHGESEANIPEISQDLERADDAAIVSLALAKLQPRHREVLIATLYEEKSAQVVSAQMGLSENAFRQLLFRSRSAFKKALIGEAETAGLSMSGILSLAARKAAADSGKIASVSGAFLLVLAMSIGVIPNLASSTSEEIVAQPLAATQSEPIEISEGEESSIVGSNEVLQQDVVAEPAVNNGQENETALGLDSALSGGLTSNPVNDSAEPEVQTAVLKNAPIAQAENVLQLERSLGQAPSNNFSGSTASFVSSTSLPSRGTVTLDSNSGLTGYVDYDLASSSGITNAWFGLSLKRSVYISVPKLSYSETSILADGHISMSYLATDLLVADTSGSLNFAVTNDTAFSRSALQVNLLFNRAGELISSSMTLSPRS